MNRIEFTVDVPGAGKKPRKLNARADLTVSSLITAIKDHFSLNGSFELRLQDSETGLPEQSGLVAAGVTPASVLKCVPVRMQSTTPALIDSGQRKRFSQKFQRVFFLDQKSMLEYDLTYWPAVIGRRDRSDPARNRLLAVDLEGAEPTPSVSRHHACITEENGQFFIEALQDNNPLYANGKRLEARFKHPLPTGATLQLGAIKLNFNVRS